MNLFEQLTEYGKSGTYPFHMPGHKRQNAGQECLDVYGIDITEITGFDNLHHPEGILKEEQDFAAKLYGAAKSFFLVNGSTCGILAAISACVERGGELLMCREAHKSVYNAAYLRQLKLHYLYGAKTELGFSMPITKESVKKALDANDRIQAVFITSPTYEGFTADIAGIVEIAHERKKAVIVDEAHGAHLGFHPYFPESALHQGADVVIQSMHKTLPSLTQTALLHLGKGTYVDEEKVKYFLGIYQTSSPSYVFMGTMAKCLHEMATDLQKEISQFEEYAEKLKDFYEACTDLQVVGVYQGKDKIKDPSKLLIYSNLAQENGEEIFEILRDDYQLEFEMASTGYVLGMTSIKDSRDGFTRLTQALHEMDEKRVEQIKKLAGASTRDVSQTLESEAAQRKSAKYVGQTLESEAAQRKSASYVGQTLELEAAQRKSASYVGQLHEPEVVYTIAEAMDSRKKEKTLLEESQGLISGEYIYCYPPGMPIVVPGERIGKEVIGYIKKCRQEGLHVQGTKDYTLRWLETISEQPRDADKQF